MEIVNFKIMKRLILTVFAVTVPIVGLAQNDGLAAYMCNKYSGNLNHSKTPKYIFARFDYDSYDVYTCMIKKQRVVQYISEQIILYRVDQ